MTAGMALIKAIKDGVQTPPPGIATLRLDRGAQWIRHFEPGLAQLSWEASPDYANLEGAVLCSWLACLADQAIFCATNTLLDAGQVTRVETLNFTFVDNIVAGIIAIEARVVSRSGDLLVSECRFTKPDGVVAVLATATTRIHDAAGDR